LGIAKTSSEKFTEVYRTSARIIFD
jgi:hypothetical protein